MFWNMKTMAVVATALALLLTLDAALSGNTIGGLNILAAFLACALAGVGVCISAYALNKNAAAKKFFAVLLIVQTATGLLALSLFWIKDFKMGYGP